jgi:predicted PurR-regulated permease PerM
MSESDATHRRKANDGGPTLVLSLFGLLAALYLFRPILVPVAMAVLLSCLLMPATVVIRRTLRVGQFTAALILCLLLGISGGYLGVLAVDHLAEFALGLPIDLSRLSSKIGQNLTEFVRDYPKLGALLPEPRLIAEFGERNAAIMIRSLGDPVSHATSLVGQGMLTLILAIFFTVEQPILQPRLAAALSRTPAEIEFYDNLFRHLSRRMRRYLLVRAGINMAFGLAVGIVLALLGVEYAAILGVFAGLANFVPYLGQAFAGLLPSLVVLAQTGSITESLMVVGIFTAMSLFEGYLVTPIIMGRTMDLNGTTVLLSCLFWGFLWGIVGLFLATPIAAITRLTMERYPEGKKWASLMSTVPELHVDQVAKTTMPSRHELAAEAAAHESAD